jgi:hypothetical protein
MNNGNKFIGFYSTEKYFYLQKNVIKLPASPVCKGFQQDAICGSLAYSLQMPASKGFK